MKMKLIVLAEIALMLFGAGLLLAQGKMLQVKGSDTMVNMVQILAEDFMAKNPKMPIAVLGGGSGTGITALINGTAEVCNSSRDIKTKEMNLAWERGVKPRKFSVAVDGLSVIVNAKNPLAQLSMLQVGAIYRGEIKNWKAVGGPDLKISLYGRQSNSGTYSFFQEHVLGNKPFSTDVKEMNGSAQIIEGVLADEGAIGYSGVGYVVDRASGQALKGLKILNINKNEKAPVFSPMDKAAVDNGSYPIARPLYMITNGAPKGAASAFIKWILSEEGQSIVAREGFYTVGGKYRAENDQNFK
jgi:phosphate transport system substrate-binding protein